MSPSSPRPACPHARSPIGAFLAPKTVSNVLGRVYAKLDIHTRAELGARMGQGIARDRSG